MVDYFTVKRRTNRLFNTAHYDIKNKTDEDELREIKSRFLATSRKLNTTYTRITDIRRTLKILGIPKGSIRLLSVSEIEEFTKCLPEGFSAFNVRLGVSEHWETLVNFFASRGNIDMAVRYIVPALQRNEEVTISRLLSTDKTTCESLIDLLKEDMEKDVISYWRRRMASEEQANKAWLALKDLPGAVEWASEYKFGGSVGGIRDSSGRTANWLIGRFNSDQKKQGTNVYCSVKFEDGDKKNVPGTSIDVANIPGEVNISMKKVKVTQDNASNTGSASDQEVEKSANEKLRDINKTVVKGDNEKPRDDKNMLSKSKDANDHYSRGNAVKKHATRKTTRHGRKEDTNVSKERHQSKSPDGLVRARKLRVLMRKTDMGKKLEKTSVSKGQSAVYKNTRQQQKERKEKQAKK